METRKTILVIGTYDTKDDELRYLSACIREQGGAVVSMDVSVLGDPSAATDISKHAVAAAAGKTIDDAVSAGDENAAMQIMARGAATLAAEMHADGRIHGAVILGGTMGTDLALDVAQARLVRLLNLLVFGDPRPHESQAEAQIEQQTDREHREQGATDLTDVQFGHGARHQPPLRISVVSSPSAAPTASPAGTVALAWPFALAASASRRSISRRCSSACRR